MEQFRILPLMTGRPLSDDVDAIGRSFLFSYEGATLLVNCGPNIGPTLKEEAIPFNTIEHIYEEGISFDSAAGLPWFGVRIKHDEKARKPTIYGVPPVIKSIYQTQEQVFAVYVDGPNALEKCFDFKSVDPVKKESFQIEKMLCSPIPAHPKEQPDSMRYGYGLLITIIEGREKKTIFFTGDCRYDYDFLKPYYDQADLILHFCCDTEKLGHGLYPEIAQLNIDLSLSIKEKTILYGLGNDFDFGAKDFKYKDVATSGILKSF